ncbi:UDP-N-acetylglucosamine transferase subunit ALG14 homolog [Bicyclus anynana]|uniref:UDP-N-acetylglucosamine transferase subunit ALG14 n=1 Tax=Bicyclus anynana TaxID=110368 RepID=A0A6J1P119_BICAN|nr:UDP-N-acetylglucosamine transferase subunit ALG14 homolog [Bicyclus anynana]
MYIMELALMLSAFFILTITARVMYLLYNIFRGICNLNSENNSLKTVYCIGSGGHTTELLRIVSHLDAEKYAPRLYIMAMNDVSSEVKIREQERDSTEYQIYRIPRSRNVKQSYVSSVFTTLYATIYTIPIICKFKPDIIFCNGPGTCVPICLVAFLLRCIFVLDCRIVFIESFCRVRTLSLSGKILQWFADIFIVQWPQLTNVCFRGKYFGRLT